MTDGLLGVPLLKRGFLIISPRQEELRRLPIVTLPIESSPSDQFDFTDHACLFLDVRYKIIRMNDEIFIPSHKQGYFNGAFGGVEDKICNIRGRELVYLPETIDKHSSPVFCRIMHRGDNNRPSRREQTLCKFATAYNLVRNLSHSERSRWVKGNGCNFAVFRDQSFERDNDFLFTCKFKIGAVLQVFDSCCNVGTRVHWHHCFKVCFECFNTSTPFGFWSTENH
mmetsp:Transcript_40023/g.83336  ORF Transcript_40023/g.83336 Transcript_40023/m.83336 type:complete len:225 (+) Transcript_40023:500-1174(+)